MFFYDLAFFSLCKSLDTYPHPSKMVLKNIESARKNYLYVVTFPKTSQGKSSNKKINGREKESEKMELFKGILFILIFRFMLAEPSLPLGRGRGGGGRKVECVRKILPLA